jgi:hypothetical protein
MVNLIRDDFKQPITVDCVLEKLGDEAGNIPLFIENCWSGLFVGG